MKQKNSTFEARCLCMSVERYNHQMKKSITMITGASMNNINIAILQIPSSRVQTVGQNQILLFSQKLLSFG